MKRLNKSLLILIFCFIISILGDRSILHAGGSLGQSGANFLQIAVEPRGAGLGGAVTAITMGANALYWNPAGAVDTDWIDVSLSHTDWILDTKLTYGAAVMKLGENNAIGISLTSFYMDELEVTTVYQPEGTGETYNAGDLSAGLSFAHRMTDKFTFGVTGKFIHEYIWNENASQVAFDVGSVYEIDFMNLRLGMVVRNFGGKLRHDGEDITNRIQEERERDEKDNPRIERLTPDFRLPQVFQMGIAIDVIRNEMNTVTMMTDVDVPSDNKERLIFASEYSFQDLAYLRAAFRVNYDTASFSFGLGMNLSNIRINYSFSDKGVFKSIHQFGVNISL